MKIALTHIYSLLLGGFFKVCYWALGMDSKVTRYFFEKYKATRRLIPGVTRGPDGYSTRMGAVEAYSSTQE